MSGNAPTPPAQNRQQAIMMGQAGLQIGGQTTAQFDANQPFSHQMMVGPLNGNGPPQRQSSLSEANGFMMQGQIMPGQPQQQMGYMGPQMPPQQRPPMGFGPQQVFIIIKYSYFQNFHSK